MCYCNELISVVGPSGGVMPQFNSLRNEFLARHPAERFSVAASQSARRARNRFFGGPYARVRNSVVGIGCAQGFVLV